MKKTVSLVTAALLAISLGINITMLTPLNAAVEMRQPGDVNGDGLVNIQDIMMVRDHIFGRTELAGDDFAAADIDFNRKIDIMDVLLIRDVVFGAEMEWAGLYREFLESDEWCLLENKDDVKASFDMVEYKIFDLDGDGVPELWLRADGLDKKNMPKYACWFYSIVDNAVVKLLHGSVTIDSIGTTIYTMYNIETGKYVIAKNIKHHDDVSSISTTKYYDIANGKLVEIETLCSKTTKINDDFEFSHTIDNMTVTYEAFRQTHAKYEWPMDKYYIVHRDWS
ncbi:MAG: dockerin type I repeat-containing protein [Clostridia bacterium]|nr:dockerin type I repeat-containing protein [Clostridia bacterium]